MLWHIVRFEITFRLRRVSTYVYFAIWFFMAFFSVSIRQFGPGSFGGKVLVNSPFVIAQVMSTLSIFGLIVMAAVFGTAIYRDFEQDTYQLFFTKPITKRDYLGGRFLGSFVVSVLIFSGLFFGLIVGAQMPWADQARLMPVDLWFHAQPFLLFSVTDIFFAGALFFTIGALTRSIVFVYLQGVLFFALYLVLLVLVQTSPGVLNANWPALVDPLGLVAFDKVTRYWTVVEKNTMTVPVEGVMLWNRAIWSGIGLLSLVALFRFFPFSAEALTRKRGKAGRSAASGDELDGRRAPVTIAIPIARPHFDMSTTFAQFRTLTGIRIASIVKEVPFWAIVLIGMLIVLVDGWYVGELVGAPVLPVTYLMAELLSGEFSLFLIIITTLYGGELVWKERTIRHDQIHDALPMKGWLNFMSQFVSLSVVQAALLGAVMAAGVLMQAIRGYYDFELHIYVKQLFLIDWPMYMQVTVAVLFLQTVLPNKFLAHALLVGYFILLAVLGRFGFEDRLYLFSAVPAFTYSDMNGYGHFVRAIATYSAYWSAFAALLGTATILLARRGADLGWRARLTNARRRWRWPMAVATGAFALSFVGLGGFIYANTHRWNPFEDAATGRHRTAAYERRYKQYERLPQPRITAVEAAVDIDPAHRSFTAAGTFTLVNRTKAPIDLVHVVDAHRALKRLAFSRPFEVNVADKALGYYIYKLATPMAPGDSIMLSFTSAHETRGFQHSEPAEFAFNGTFFDRDYFPFIGYQRGGELSDEDERRDEGLGPAPDLPLPTDAGARDRNLFSSDADWITFKATVSTSPDQIAIAPGYLQREWQAGGRRYFAYDMGDARISNFYSFLSGRYEVRRETWQGVNIEVYYDAKHPFNVDRMIASTKASLEYFTKNFGPYQFRQFRILEFPRYRGFAQSFPNTVPYSEGIGFIANPTKDDDPDVPFYVTAHELAHQWWGHQVVGAYAQGSNMLSETLAQYSALMVMEHEVGSANIRTYLRQELDRYLAGRSRERRKEMPLSRVQNEGYVWYQKGSLAMYALKDYMGEDQLNAALRKYLERVRFQDAPFTTAIEFVDALRDAAPLDLKPVVDDLFNTITLFDNRAVEATWRPAADGTFAVTIKVTARKLRADGLGAETPVAINDLVDIGVFVGDGKNQKALFLEKRRITASDMTFEVIVKEQPARAGIDPYNKLIDRQSDDNVMAATKAR